MTMEIVGNDAQFNGKVTLLKDLEIYGDIKNKTKDTSFDFSDNFSFKIQGDEKLNIGNDNTIFKSKGIERLQITSGGNVLVGGSGVSQTNRELVIGSNSEADLAIETHNTSPSETANIRFYRSRGTAASPLPLIDNDELIQQRNNDNFASLSDQLSEIEQKMMQYTGNTSDITYQNWIKERSSLLEKIS